MNKTTEAREEHDHQPVISAYPVVGIGASAGGLQALIALFSQLPSTTGIAYIVVQHMDPKTPSILSELLARASTLPIQDAEEGMAVQPDRGYVCPPHAQLTFKEGVFHLSSAQKPSGRPDVIDHLLISLSQARGPQAVGVLLSGTGSDGTAGLQAIRDAGGMTFAQNPTTAAFPQMPQNAIATGCVDHILSPQEIAHVLAQLVEHASLPQVQPQKPGSEEEAGESGLTSILHLLSQQSGVDFLAYKPTTLKRRIENRMTLAHFAHLSAYAAYLDQHPDEIGALVQSVLIGVTDFFRDPAVFETLTKAAWPTILARRAQGEALRIWVPGCATGEEAYTLAISLLEFLRTHEAEQPFQIFATDVNVKALATARASIYPQAALALVDAAIRERYFTPVDRQGSYYRINPQIREYCLFAPHNLLHDPPFIHMDLISCRNVLIYLRASVQQQILRLFHYALVPEGFLLLGTSESVEPLARLFRRIEHGKTLYRTQAFEGIQPPPFGTSARAVTVLTHQEGGRAMAEEPSLGVDILQEADRLLLANYVPASVVIDADQEIVQVRGETAPYLQLATGRANLNLFKMARPGLSMGVRAAVRTARTERRASIQEGLHLSSLGSTRQVRVTAIPLKGPPANQYCLVLFEEQASEDVSHEAVAVTTQASLPDQKDKRGQAQRRIAALEQELSVLHIEMGATLEEHEAATEELQTANEEIRASNEELRSLNEELETSKEELQATNEELATANQELAARNDQLKAAQEYAEAMVETVHSPLVVLSEELRIERANLAFYLMFKTTPPETEGRLLTELGQGLWEIQRLRTLVHETLATNRSFPDVEVEQVFPRIGRKTLLLSARRLLLERQSRSENRILLAMEDITERRAAEQAVVARLTFLQHLLDALPNSVYLVQGAEARLVLANRASTQLWGAEWHTGQPMLAFLESNHIEILDSQGQSLPPAAFATMRALQEGQVVAQYQEVIHHADGTTLPVLVNAVPIAGQEALAGLEAMVGTGHTEAPALAVLVVHQDVGIFKEAEELKDHFLALVAHELRTPLSAVKGFASMLSVQTARGNGPPLAEWQVEAIAEIELGADRMTRLTRDLLDVIRLQAGRLTLQQKSLDLLSLVQWVIADLQRSTGHHQLTLRLDPVSLSEVLVWADGGRIEQVLSNLLSNAIKYSLDGGAIEVTVRKEEEWGTALISVRDQGIGIPQADQARLFGRFVRASSGEAQGISGTGMGLYLCRELVIQHGGQIWFESREGVGSTFFVRLPLLPDHPVTEESQHPSIPERNQ